MVKRKKLSLLEKTLVGATGVVSFIAAREPITNLYTNFIADRTEINDYLDAMLVAGHVAAAGILVATAVGSAAAYGTKKIIDYINHNETTPVIQ